MWPWAIDTSRTRHYDSSDVALATRICIKIYRLHLDFYDVSCNTDVVVSDIFLGRVERNLP